MIYSLFNEIAKLLPKHKMVSLIFDDYAYFWMNKYFSSIFYKLKIFCVVSKNDNGKKKPWVFLTLEELSISNWDIFVVFCDLKYLPFQVDLWVKLKGCMAFS